MILKYPIDNIDELIEFTDKDLEEKLEIAHPADRAEMVNEFYRFQNADKQIRHFRKFAGAALLGPWDILRNLSVIRNQLQALYKHLDDDAAQLSEEQREFMFAMLKEIAKDKTIIEQLKLDDIQLKTKRNTQIGAQCNQDNDEKSWMDWKKIVEESNKKLHSQLKESHRDSLLELTEESVVKLTDDQKRTASSLFSAILNFERKQQEDEDTFTSEENTDDELRYYVAFKNSWTKVPEWWSPEHDVLLLELAVRFDWNVKLINKELTDPSKKLYYQQLLRKKSNNEEDDKYDCCSESDKEEESDDIKDAEIEETKKTEETKEVEQKEVIQEIEQQYDGTSEELMIAMDDIEFGKLSDYKHRIIEWIKEDDVNFTQIKGFTRQEFGAKIVGICDNNKKMRGPSMKFYKEIQKLVPPQPLQSDEEEEEEYNEEVEGLVFALQTESIKLGNLSDHKESIIEWIQENKICPNTIKDMERKDFGDKIVEICDNNKRMRGPAMKLFKIIQKIGATKTEQPILSTVENMDLGRLSPYKENIINWIKTDNVDIDAIKKFARKDFGDKNG